MKTLLAAPTPFVVPNPAKYRSVTERLSDRCAELEALVSTLIGNVEWCHREIVALSAERQAIAPVKVTPYHAWRDASGTYDCPACGYSQPDQTRRRPDPVHVALTPNMESCPQCHVALVWAL